MHRDPRVLLSDVEQASADIERFIDGMTGDAYGGQGHVRHMMARLLQD